MAESKSEFIDALGKLLDLDREAVTQRLANMEVDSVLNAIDAVNRNDREDAADIVGTDDREVEDESAENDETDVEDDEPEINALFYKGDGKKSSRKSGKKEYKDAPFDPNLGDDVRIGEEEGIVKIQNGPNNTMGVTIDGEMTMVNKKDVNKLEEGILGMTALQDIRRMKELAGLPVDPMDAAQDTSPLDIEVETVDPQAYLAPGPVADIPAEETSIAPAPCPPTPAVAPVAPVAEVPAEIEMSCEPIKTTMTFDGVVCALDEIEEALPNLMFRDAKCVRDRLNKLISCINESAATRKKKV